jgi:phosphate:Na+ symporter
MLQEAILQFLARLREGNLSAAQSQIHVALMSAAIHFRNIADIIVAHLASVTREAAAGHLAVGALKRTVLSDCYKNVQRALTLAIEAVFQPSPGIRGEVEIVSDQVKELAEKLMSQIATGATDSKNLNTVRQQTIFLDGLRQISSLAKRIVQSMTQEKVIDLSKKRGAIPANRAIDIK